MVVDQVGVGRVVGQSLVPVGHPTRHEDRLVGAHLQGERRAEARAGAKIHPGAQDAP